MGKCTVGKILLERSDEWKLCRETRGERVRKWSSFGDTRDTVQARKVAAKALLSLSFLEFPFSSPLQNSLSSPLTFNLLSLPRSSSLEPIAFSSFEVGRVAAPSATRKGGCGEKCLWAGRSTPGGSTGQEKEVRRDLVGWGESARGPPFLDIKRVTRVTAGRNRKWATWRLPLSLFSSKVDLRKYRREKEREKEGGERTGFNDKDGRPCWFLYCNMAAVGSPLKSIAISIGCWLLALWIIQCRSDTPIGPIPFSPWWVCEREREEIGWGESERREGKLGFVDRLWTSFFGPALSNQVYDR